MTEHPTNGWQEWKNHVLAEQTRLADQLDTVGDKLDQLRTDVVILKTKAAFYGGGVALVVTVLVDLIMR